MTKGTIRRLIADRGYGFIQTEQNGDLFFHANDPHGVTFDSLTEGQQVEFEITPISKWPAAVNVMLTTQGR